MLREVVAERGIGLDTIETAGWGLARGTGPLA